MSLLQVYIVECSDGKYYTGVSYDIERRLYEHNYSEEYTSYTYSRRPVKLVWHSDEMSPDQAIELEKQLKGWRREKKAALINGQWNLLHELSRRKKKK